MDSLYDDTFGTSLFNNVSILVDDESLESSPCTSPRHLLCTGCKKRRPVHGGLCWRCRAALFLACKRRSDGQLKSRLELVTTRNQLLSESDDKTGRLQYVGVFTMRSLKPVPSEGAILRRHGPDKTSLWFSGDERGSYPETMCDKEEWDESRYQHEMEYYSTRHWNERLDEQTWPRTYREEYGVDGYQGVWRKTPWSMEDWDEESREQETELVIDPGMVLEVFNIWILGYIDSPGFPYMEAVWSHHRGEHPSKPLVRYRTFGVATLSCVERTHITPRNPHHIRPGQRLCCLLAKRLAQASARYASTALSAVMPHRALVELD
jgi:hypothetical protein